MRKFICWMAVAVLVAMGAGCAGKQLTPEEAAAERERQLRMTTRVYEGKTPKEILLAADRIFRLADDDYKIAHTETMMQAQRPWMIYLVISAAFGTDTWLIETFPVENGTKVVARHSGQAQSVFAGPTVNSGGTGVTAMTSPTMMNITTFSGIYDLFFARLDYFMGKRENWTTCRDAKNFEGPLDPFCTVANDRLPDGRPSRVLYEKKEEKSDSIL